MARRGRGVPPPVDPQFEWMQNVIENQQKMMQDMLQMQHDQMGLQQPNHQPHQEDPNRTYFRFQKMKPPTYKGGPDPMTAYYWIDSMEKIFHTLQCGEEEKVICAANVLNEDAHTWWCNARQMMELQGTPLTWDNFKELFLKQYFPSVKKLSKQAEFVNLKQGDLSVGEYAAKFERLSQFYELGRYAPNDMWKMQMFKEGLRADVSQGLSSYTLVNYPALVQQAYVAEEDLRKMYAERKDYWKGKKKVAESSTPSRQSKEDGYEGKQVQSFDSSKVRRCGNCGKRHQGDCWQKPNRCYHCNEEGHYANECPTKKSLQGTPNAPRHGRINTLDAQTITPKDNLLREKQGQKKSQRHE